MKKLSLFLLVFVFLLASCVPGESETPADFVLHAGTGARSYLGDDCNEGLLAQFRQETGVCIGVKYIGTVEASQEMDAIALSASQEADSTKQNQPDAFLLEDGVWANPNFKTQVKVAEGYIVLGIDQTKANSIGWATGSKHSIHELIALMSSGQLDLIVCNANQCSSGALFFMAIINGLKNKNLGTLVIEDLTD